MLRGGLVIFAGTLHAEIKLQSLAACALRRAFSAEAVPVPAGGVAAAAAVADAPPSDGTASPSQDKASTTSTTRAAYRPPLGSSLLRYGRDLTAAAAAGQLDPLLGRADVVERTLQILLRRTKNNPVLIGDPGTGKTAIVEGIAAAAASPAAPAALRGRSIVALDVGALVAGTQYRGAFEERLQGILKEVRDSQGQVILFIDEIHTLVDAGRVAEGGMNAANLLKPALARGELRCIGATTVEEYRRHVEADAAFARRLQPVMVEEPSAEEATIWLRGLAGRYAAHHGVRFADEAVPTAVAMAQRFVADRRLPDSAIDILDEAASRAQLRRAAGEALADELAEIAAATVAVEAPAGNVAVTLPPQQQQLPGGRSPEEVRTLLEWFGAAPDAPLLPGAAAHRQTAEARRRIFLEQFGQGAYASTAQSSEESTEEAAAASSNALPCPHCGTPTPSVAGAITVNCPRCAFRFLNIPPEKLMMGASLFLKPAAQRDSAGPKKESLKEAPAVASAAAPETPPSPEAPLEDDLPVVGPLEVMEVVAASAGVPLQQVMSVRSSWSTLRSLEPALAAAVVGQAPAVHAVAAAVRLGSALGFQHKRRRPLVAIMLSGPRGVGKRRLAAALATALFGSDRALLTFDLAQATDKTAVNRLVGSPPGFVGYGEGGALTEAVRRRPHTVIVFENAQAAHPDVLSLLRQILNEGELHDSMGKRADFRNAVVLLTVPGAGPEAAGNGGGEGPGGAGFTQRLGPDSRRSASSMALEENEAAPSAQQAQRQWEWPGPAAAPLPPDMMAALDSIVLFRPLSPEDLATVASRMVEEAAPALAEQGIELSVAPAALAAAVGEASAGGGGALGLGAAVRSLILAPAVDAALREMAADEELQAGGGRRWAAAVDVEGEGVQQSVVVRVTLRES